MHISQVSVKANQKLGFIKRNLKGSPGAKRLYSLHCLGTLRYGSRMPGVEGPSHQQGPGRPRESPNEGGPLD